MLMTDAIMTPWLLEDLVSIYHNTTILWYNCSIYSQCPLSPSPVPQPLTRLHLTKLMNTLFKLHSKQESQDFDSFDHQIIQSNNQGK